MANFKDTNLREQISIYHYEIVTIGRETKLAFDIMYRGCDEGKFYHTDIPMPEVHSTFFDKGSFGCTALRGMHSTIKELFQQELWKPELAVEPDTAVLLVMYALIDDLDKSAKDEEKIDPDVGEDILNIIDFVTQASKKAVGKQEAIISMLRARAFLRSIQNVNFFWPALLLIALAFRLAKSRAEIRAARSAAHRASTRVP
jgi:hypothetical protein